MDWFLERQESPTPLRKIIIADGPKVSASNLQQLQSFGHLFNFVAPLACLVLAMSN
jgi:hypothetical protein